MVLLTFDFDAESAQMRQTPDLPVAISKGRYARIGIERILETLRKFGISSTFFVPGWTAQRYDDQVRLLLADGHEIGTHGYLHERLNEMKPAEEWKMHEKSSNIIEQITGRKPMGFRAPYWEWSTSTLTFLRKAGYRYDSSLMDEDEPYLLSDEGKPTGMVELPVSWTLDDWGLFEVDRRGPDEVFEIWRAEFEAIYERNIPYFMLTMHPECIGRPARIRMLELLIESMIRKPGVAFSTCAEVAEHWAGRPRVE